MTRKLLLLLTLAAVAAAAVAATSGASSPPSCLRGGARLVAAQDSVQVVKIRRRPTSHRTRIDSVVACWAPTGRRATILREEDFGDDLRTTTRIRLVDGRYVGIIVRYEGGVSESLRAVTFDARTLREVHDSAACDFDRGDRSGVDDAAFLPGGGMAFSCNRLYVFRTAAAGEPELLEPAGTDVRTLAVGEDHADFRARLYWSVATGETVTARTLELGS